MRRTRASIIAAFSQLLEERPLNKITVKDIVDRCDINRNTFYYHFQDIPALLQEMMEEKVNVLIENHCALGRPLDCLKPALQYGAAHKQAVLHVYRAIPRETFLLYLNRFAQHMVGEYFDSISKTVNGALSVTSIKKLVADVDEAKRITHGFSLNPEIEAFLQKVSSQQATIVDLTPNVLTWLKEKKLTSKLKVRF